MRRLAIPWSNIKTVTGVFHDTHEQRYGHSLEAPIELVNIRLSIQAQGVDLLLPDQVTADELAPEIVTVYGCREPALTIHREQLTVDKKLPGPLIVCDTVATTFVAPGWTCQMDKTGNLILKKM